MSLHYLVSCTTTTNNDMNTKSVSITIQKESPATQKDPLQSPVALASS